MEPWNLFKAEKDHLELVQHSWIADSAHKRVLHLVEVRVPSSSGQKPMKILKKEVPSPSHSKFSSSKASKSNKKKYQ
jgi:hypothetical protein